MSTQEELEARIAAAKARQAAIADAQTTAAIAAAQAVEAKDQAYSLLDNTIQGNEENTFTAAQTFQAPVTVGTPRAAAVWASKSVGIMDVNMRKSGTISDNDGHMLEIPEDATRTQNQFVALVEASELGLKVTHVGTTYYFYDSSSPAGQEGTIGNARRLYVNGLGWTSQQTWALAGGKDGVAEVGHPMMLNGNVYIGHGPEGVKARCYFGITAAYLYKAGALTDNSTQHPVGIELPEDQTRTIDTLIAEINAQGEKLDIKATKYNATNIYLESVTPGSFANSIVFTRTGCLSTSSNGAAQTTTQGSNIQGLDEGTASEWELRENGYPVASRQSNNVYEGVQVFNNTVALNGPVQGPGIDAFGAALIAPLSGGSWLSGVTNGTSFNYRVLGENVPSPKRTRIYGNFIVWVLPDVVNANSITRTGRYQTENATVIFSYPNATSGSVPIGWESNSTSGLHARLYAPKMTTMNTVCSGMWTTCEIFAEALQSLTAGISYDAYTANGKTKSFTLHAPVLKTLRIGSGNVIECIHLYTPQVNVLDNLFTYAASTSTMPKLVEFLLTDSSHVTTAKNAFVGCTVLPANQYPTNWSSLEHGDGMFSRCTLLDATTANAILDSLPDWSTQETPTEHIITFTGTAAATTWAADGADLSHVTAAEAKGWTVEGAPTPVTE